MLLDEKEYKGYNFACWNLAFLLLFCCNPYPKWMLPNGTTQVIFLCTTLYSLTKLKHTALVGYVYQRHTALFAIIAYSLYYSFPAVHDVQLGWLINGIVFILILNYHSEIYAGALENLKRILFVICCFSLFVWFLHLIHIEIPHYNFDPDFRYYSTDRYRIYGLCVSLCKGNDYTYGEIFERICGVFAEPGHFGIYLGLLFAYNRFVFRNWKDYLMLITGILTFSTALYGIFAIGLMYSVVTKKVRLHKIVFFVLLFLPVLLINDSFLDMAYGRTLGKKESSSVVSLVENRTTETTRRVFNDFAKSERLLLGCGNEQNADIQVTNWRGIIYRYGIVGFVLMIVSAVIFARNNEYLYSICLLSIFLLVLSHRVYLLYSMGILIYLYVIANNVTPLEEDIETEDNEEQPI